jgi:hypothetical protein
MVVLYRTKAAKEQFIKHIEYLLKLKSSKSRARRNDWRSMVKMFKQAGYRFYRYRGRKYDLDKRKERLLGKEGVT